MVNGHGGTSRQHCLLLPDNECVHASSGVATWYWPIGNWILSVFILNLVAVPQHCKRFPEIYPFAVGFTCNITPHASSAILMPLWTFQVLWIGTSSHFTRPSYITSTFFQAGRWVNLCFVSGSGSPGELNLVAEGAHNLCRCCSVLFWIRLRVLPGSFIPAFYSAFFISETYDLLVKKLGPMPLPIHPSHDWNLLTVHGRCLHRFL